MTIVQQPWRWQIGVWGVLMVLAMGIPSGSAAEFRIAVGVDPDTLDPVQVTTTTVGNIVDYVVETLTKLAPDGSIEPSLAERWTVSPDGLQYTFTLRQGLTFHDSTPLNAGAVKWNLDRLMDPEIRVPARASYPIAQTEVVDPATVRVTLTRPYAPLVSALSSGTAGILSPASAERHGNTAKNYTHLVGTGPYMWQGRKKGEKITVTKYADYWGRKPHYDQVVFRMVPEAATRESLLLAGQVDLIVLPPIADLPALQRNKAVKVLLAPSDRTMFIALNTQKPPLNNIKVRQALNYAVDKQAILTHVLFGAGELMDAPMAPSLFGYCKVGAYAFDPVKAKHLLAEAGVTPGTPLSLLHPTGRYVQEKEAMQAVAGYLREVGFIPQLQTMDWPAYLRTIHTPLAQGNTTQLHYLGWAPSYLDASQQMLPFLSSYAPPHGLATTFYANPEVDTWIKAAEAERSPEQRQALYCQIARQVWHDAPWIFLWVQHFPIVHSAKVTGIGSLPNEEFDAVYAQPAR